MNKKEIIEKIADASGLTQKDIGKFLDSFVETVTEAMMKKSNIASVGFCTFSTVKRAEKVCRDFNTGKNIQVLVSRSV